MSYPLLICDPCGRKAIRHKDDGLEQVKDHKGRPVAYSHMHRCTSCGARRVFGQYTGGGGDRG